MDIVILLEVLVKRENEAQKNVRNIVELTESTAVKMNLRESYSNRIIEIVEQITS